MLMLFWLTKLYAGSKSNYFCGAISIFSKLSGATAPLEPPLTEALHLPDKYFAYSLVIYTLDYFSYIQQGTVIPGQILIYDMK